MNATIQHRATVRLAALHAMGSPDELDAAFVGVLEAIAPDAPAAVLMLDDEDGSDRLRVRLGTAACPLAKGSVVAGALRLPPGGRTVPLRSRGVDFGELVVWRPLAAEVFARLVEALEHYAVAAANLAVLAIEQAKGNAKAACLTATDEATALFEEEDPAAVRARLLQVACNLAQAPAGALYLLEETGDADSALRLDQALGMPESLLDGIVAANGGAWPRNLIDGPVRVERRGGAGDGIGGMAAASLPGTLQGVVVLPLHFAGVSAGVCVLFNPDVAPLDVGLLAQQLEPFRKLAAASLYRVHLERRAARSRAEECQLAIAAQLQRSNLPTESPTTDAYEFAWSSIAAERMGGDHLDLLAGGDGAVHLVIADASGHGIDSAMLMQSFCASWRGAVQAMPPEALAARHDAALHRMVADNGIFVTAAFVRLAADGRSARIAGAGHNPVLHWRAAERRLEAVAADGPPLGFTRGATFGACDVPLAAGDVLLLYTDGITEASRDGGPMFGDERLRACLQGAVDQPAAVILAALRQALRDWTGRERQDDDVSLVVVKVGGAPA